MSLKNLIAWEKEQIAKSRGPLSSEEMARLLSKTSAPWRIEEGPGGLTIAGTTPRPAEKTEPPRSEAGVGATPEARRVRTFFRRVLDRLRGRGK